MELISIIIPVYNNTETLNRAIDSCLNQKYPETEIILVSDGADARTLAILNDYWERYPNIKIVLQDHLGILKARLNGLHNASGSYVTFVDSDDYINSIYLYELMYAKKYNPANIILGKTNYLKKKTIMTTSKVYPSNFKISEHKELLLSIDCSLNGKLFKKEDIVLTDYKLKANEAMSYLYYYLCKSDSITFNNFAKYYVTDNFNRSTKIYIEDNLYFIENVIRPLDIMFDLFKSGKLLNLYYAEIEGLFIKNILLEIKRIKKTENRKDITDKLITILIKYLNSHFPNWRTNKYLKRHFIDFNNNLILDLNFINLSISTNKTNNTMSSNEAIRSFKKIVR